MIRHQNKKQLAGPMPIRNSNQWQGKKKCVKKDKAQVAAKDGLLGVIGKGVSASKAGDYEKYLGRHINKDFM